MIRQLNSQLSFTSKVGQNLASALEAVNTAYDPNNQFDSLSRTKNMAQIQSEQTDKRFTLVSMLEESADTFTNGNKIHKNDQVDIQAKASLLEALPKLISLEDDSQIKGILGDILEKISGK